MDYFELRALLGRLVLPPVGPLLLAVAGLMLARYSRFRAFGMRLCVAGILVLWLLSTPVVAHHLVSWVERHPSLDMNRPVAAQAIVILGGGTRRFAPEYGGPAPRELTLQRLAYGARVARKTGLPVLVTGGGAEGAMMESFLREDFQLSVRWVEPLARNTHENAVLSAALLREARVDTIILVTSALHMHRAVAEFEAQGLHVIPAPVDVSRPIDYLWSDFVPGMAALRNSHYALYETLGDLVRRIQSGH